MSDPALQWHRELKPVLPSLTPRQRTVFAALCAERVVPYLEPFDDLAKLARDALNEVWVLSDGVTDFERLDPLTEQVAEVCDNEDEATEGDLVQAMEAVQQAIMCVLDPESTQRAAHAASFALTLASYPDCDSPEQGAAEEAAWQRKALLQVQQRGDRGAVREDFSGLLEARASWIAFSVHA